MTLRTKYETVPLDEVVAKGLTIDISLPPRNVLSISYDESLLLTRKLLLENAGFVVTSALGFTEAVRACQQAGTADLVIIGHTIPHPEKVILLGYVRASCSAPVLAVVRPSEEPLPEQIST